MIESSSYSYMLKPLPLYWLVWLQSVWYVSCIPFTQIRLLASAIDTIGSGAEGWEHAGTMVPVWVTQLLTLPDHTTTALLLYPTLSLNIYISTHTVTSSHLRQTPQTVTKWNLHTISSVKHCIAQVCCEHITASVYVICLWLWPRRLLRLGQLLPIVGRAQQAVLSPQPFTLSWYLAVSRGTADTSDH